MQPHTKQAYHYGVNFIVAPPPAISAAAFLRFQTELADQAPDLVFEQSQQAAQQLQLLRQNPPLQVTVSHPAPPVGQLAVLAPLPARLTDPFVQETELVIEAYKKVWSAPVQIIRRDCTIRHLYAVREEHAFRFLWESRLRQDEAGLARLGRPVLGGGLRLVMPNSTGEAETPSIELKIESLLADARKLYVELSCAWDKNDAETGFAPRAMIEYAEKYLDEHVKQFILESTT